MIRFPSQVRFRHGWRDYQKRVLDELDSHLGDDKLHVVAPPGSGKTVLGLEVVRRLDKPTLILSPTVVIRNQWIDRLCGLFLAQPHPRPRWISTSLRKPRFLTAATYQAVHRAWKDDSKSNLAELLSRLKVQTLVLDEAHHLKNAWWHSLQEMIEQLRTVTIVAVTATPPYDVSYAEWKRYRHLCGPVDAEISVPELVQRGDLCFHQDYVFLSTPHGNEADQLATFRKEADQFKADLAGNPSFADALQQHPWMVDFSTTTPSPRF